MVQSMPLNSCSIYPAASCERQLQLLYALLPGQGQKGRREAARMPGVQ